MLAACTLHASGGLSPTVEGSRQGQGTGAPSARDDIPGLLSALDGLYRAGVSDGGDDTRAREVLGEAVAALRRALVARCTGPLDDEYLAEIADERPDLRQRIARLRSGNSDLVRRLDGVLWRFAEHAATADLVPAVRGVVAAIRAHEVEVGDLSR